jgi:heptosyltransferase-3
MTIPRPPEANKYQVIPAFFSSMGIETTKIFPLLLIEKVRRIKALAGGNHAPIVGVFVGGRKAKGKRWSLENFIQLITSLRAQGIKVIVFLAPKRKG